MSKAHIDSDCDVLVPRYTFSIPDPDPKDLYSFTVTPRNNVEGARNGNSSTINGTYSYESKLYTYTLYIHAYIWQFMSLSVPIISLLM